MAKEEKRNSKKLIPLIIILILLLIAVPVVILCVKNANGGSGDDTTEISGSGTSVTSSPEESGSAALPEQSSSPEDATSSPEDETSGPEDTSAVTTEEVTTVEITTADNPAETGCRHVIVADEAVAPTCTAAGLTAGTHCSVCGEVLEKQQSVPAKGHSEAIIAGKAATCTESGMTDGVYCTVCSEVISAQVSIPAKGHTPSEWITDKEATVTAEGSRHKECTVCGTVLEKETLPKATCNHTYDDGKITTQPDCIHSGIKTYTCKDCGNTRTETVAALGHKEETVAGKAATCTESGLTDGKKCSVCGEILVAQTAVAAKGHTPELIPGKASTCTETGLTDGEKCSVCGVVTIPQTTVEKKAHTPEAVPGKEATCTETGLTDGEKCSVCGNILKKQDIIPLKDHTPETIPGKEATCTETGLTEGAKCSACGKILTEQTTVKLKEHTPVTVPGKAASCTETGLSEWQKCSVCGKTLVEQTVTQKVEHKPSDWITDTEATVLAEGKKHKECTACGTVLETGTIPKSTCDHEYDSGVITSEPDCTNTGIRTFTCKHCGATKTEIVAAKGHTPETVAGKAATCTEPGLTDGTKCKVCGVTLTEQTNIEPKGHSYTEKVDANFLKSEASCTAKAVYYKSCSVCGAKGTDTFEYGSMLSHTVVADPAIEPTCTATGLTEGSHCSVCKAVLVAQATVKAKGHTEEILPAKAATCTESGLTEGKKCKVCGEITLAQKTISAKGHTKEMIPAKQPNCTEAGYTYSIKCTVCNEILIAPTPIPATGHKEQILSAVAATCTSEGLTQGKQCVVCDVITVPQQTVAKTAHTEQIIPAVAPTCTEAGRSEGKKCSVCGTVLVAQQTVGATGHKEQILAAVAPTCTATGLTEGRKCTICQTVTVQQSVVGKVAHTEQILAAVAPTCTATGLTEGRKCTVCQTVTVPQSVVGKVAHTEQILAAVAPTCTATGLTEGKKCTVCQTVTVQQTVIPALGHNYVNGVCTRCTDTLSISKIEVAHLPNKTSYFVGDTLDSAGLIITVTYSNNSTGTVTSGFTCSPTTLNTATNQLITVSYSGKTTSFTVSVNEPPEAYPTPSFNIVKDGVLKVNIKRPNGVENSHYSVSATNSVVSALSTYVKSGESVAFSFDSITEGKHDPTTLEIVIGPTNYDETAEVMSTLKYGDYAVKAVGNKIVIAAMTPAAMTKAVTEFTNLLKNAATKNSSGIYNITLSRSAINKTGTSDKMLSALPLLGNTSFTWYNPGNDCEEMIFPRMTPAKWTEYVGKLKTGGFTEYTSREVEGNYFATLYNSSYTINIGYYKNNRDIRLIIEPYSKKTLIGLPADNTYDVVTTSQITMLGLEYKKSDGSYGSNGMSIIIRLTDGRFIVIDGGFNRTEDATLLINTIKEQSAAYSSQKGMVIAAWIVTHAHSDHFGMINGKYSLILLSGIKIQRFLVNFMSDDERYLAINTYTAAGSTNWSSNEGGDWNKTITVAKLFGADVIPVHVGQLFYFADLTIDCLYTIESYGPKLVNALNTTSLIMKMTFTDPITKKQTTYLSTGDATGPGFQITVDMFGDYLKSDIVQVAHHGYTTWGNEIGTITAYQLAAPATVLWPQGIVANPTYRNKDYNKAIWDLSSNPNYKETYVAGTEGAKTILPMPYTVGSAIVK